MNYLYTVVINEDAGGMHYDISDYVFIILFSLFVLGFIFFMLKWIRNTVKERKKLLKEMEQDVEMAPITEIEARVLKKECFVRSYGIKMPETRKEFYITFSTFAGEIRRYSVSEELYLSVEENTVGTIAIVNDMFFDFYFEK